jgi:hypothetical protein
MRRLLVIGVLILGGLSSPGGARAQSPFAGASSRASAAPAAPPFTPDASSRPPKPEPRQEAVRFTLSPEWGYRTFRAIESSSTDKVYNAPGIPAVGARLELYPLAFIAPAPEIGRDFGLTVGYSRALSLESRDIDTDTTVGTQWYQLNFGVRFRILGGYSPLSLGFTAGVQRWVYDFDTTPSNRLVPIGRYTLLPVGVDARYTWGAFSVFGDARFLLPVTVSQLGDRVPIGAKLGFNGALGAAYALSRFFEVEVRGAYTLVTFGLPAVAGRPDERGTVTDGYVVLSAGATVRY